MAMGKAGPTVPRCGAKTKSGKPCDRAPIVGKARCYRHGGQHSGRRITHARNTAWAKTLGPIWEALKEDDLRDLNIDLVIVAAREAELRERLGEGDSGAFRKKAVALLSEVRTAGARNDGQAVAAAMGALSEHLTNGADREGVWAELERTVDRHSKLVETIAGIETRAGNCLTGRAIAMLLGTLFDMVQAEVGDEGAYRVGLRFEQSLSQKLPGGPAFTPLLALPADIDAEFVEIPD